MKVDLLQASNLSIVVEAARICYQSEGDNLSEKDKKLIRSIIKSGHESVIEHCFYTYKIQGISRVCSHQLVRHRIASYSQQSHRFTKVSDFNLPEGILKLAHNSKTLELYEDVIMAHDLTQQLYEKLIKAGVKKEDARYILPQSALTSLIMTINARSLRNFFKLRLNKRAQAEIRLLAENMFLKLPKEHRDWLFFDIQDEYFGED